MEVLCGNLLRSLETTFEPHRDLITGVVNQAKSSIGILPMHRDGPNEPRPAEPLLQDPAPTARDADGMVARSAAGAPIVCSYTTAAYVSCALP